MQMVYHIGVHGTDGDRMLKTLLNNRGRLLRDGTEVVTPNRHRGVFEEALAALNGGPATPEMEQIMLDAVLDSDDPQRIICTSPGFLGVPSRAIGPEGLYPQAGARIAALANLFPSGGAEFFVAIRNPATLIADVLALHGGDYTSLMGGVDPLSLSWLTAMQRMAAGAQGRRLVVWCHEDAPIIWPDIVRLVGGLPASEPLPGGLLYMHELLGDQGLRELRGALSGRELPVSQRRDLYAEHLQRNVLPHMVEQEITLPGWTQDTVDQVSARYYQDIPRIAALPGVEFILA
ncbi:MAG: hypothetical protein Q4G14_03535 [Paracoccus sp. (in: a-proteobacteria)]|uniref:hypothetical protein n=1 Tax=Paracoccus sp. TaxID=267 RepID=UPI0026DF1930|nr:hypothetical protein [Paracoccus sp. (in: a-proteobacteria)]MDO5612298.1 hypothetical protein [Paracoccus sp. (in: a-proteobacteria)]